METLTQTPNNVIQLPTPETQPPVPPSPDKQAIITAQNQAKYLLASNPTSETVKQNWEAVRKAAQADNLLPPRISSQN